MKAPPLLVVTACLLYGCSSSELAKNTQPGFPELPPEAPQRGPAPLLVYVSGEFCKPGPYTWTNGMTLKDAFSAAGGFTEFAWERIHLHHYDGSVERFSWSEKRPLTNNPALRPGDSVINPRH
jgi:hypothetical protein